VAHVALDATHITVDGRDEPITPGMAVTTAERDRLAGEWRKSKLDAAGLWALRDDLKTGKGLSSFQPPPRRQRA